MSRTYKYPREALDASITRDEAEADRRIQERLKRQKKQQEKRVKARFRKSINFRANQRARA